MTRSYKLIGVILVGILFCFSILEFQKYKNNVGIFVDENIVLIKTTPGIIFSYGETNTTQAKRFLGDLQAFWSHPIQKIEDMEQGVRKASGVFQIEKTTEKSVLIENEKQKIWVVNGITEEEIQTIKYRKIALSGDMVFFQKKDDLSFLSQIPEQIIYWGKGRIPNTIKKQAEKEKKSLISVSKMNGISLTRKDGKWKLYARK